MAQEQIEVSYGAALKTFRGWQDIFNALDTDNDKWLFATALRGADISNTETSKAVFTCSVRHRTDSALSIFAFFNLFADKTIEKIADALIAESAYLTGHYYYHVTEGARALARYYTYMEQNHKLAVLYKLIGDLASDFPNMRKDDSIKILTEARQILLDLGVLKVVDATSSNEDTIYGFWPTRRRLRPPHLL